MGNLSQNLCNVGGKPGDWLCPGCNDLQFARNEQCRRCGMAKPETAGVVLNNQQGLLSGDVSSVSPSGGFLNSHQAKPGDWLCPGCNDLQFARNEACRRCGTLKPIDAAGAAVAGGGNNQCEKPGDWHCPSCNDLVFARNG